MNQYRAPSMAAYGLPAGRVVNELPVTRKLACDRPCLVVFTLPVAGDNSPSIQLRFASYVGIRAARDRAWDFADHIRPLTGIGRDSALTTEDQVAGALGRSLLLVL